MSIIISALLILILLCAIIASILNLLSRHIKTDDNQLVEQINALLPQTQCAQCNFPGCRPYAQAISENKADINRCPPGGEATIKKLAALLNREFTPLSTEVKNTQAKQIAIIDEENCIGCVKCISACPVDAIIGARGQMHTVIPDLCTGCELCIVPCPMDCITMQPIDITAPWRNTIIQKISS